VIKKEARNAGDKNKYISGITSLKNLFSRQIQI
jgi:hypothetical protein